MNGGFGDAPFPPSDLAGRDYRRSALGPSDTLWRIHRADREACYFGRSGRNRFDIKDLCGVCYAAASPDGAFVETFGRGDPVDRLMLEDRAISQIAITAASAHLVKLHGDGLAALGATAEVAHGRDYALSQAWSARLFQHPGTPMGIAYRARHDDDEIAYALFERCPVAVRAPPVRLIDFPQVWNLMTKYQVSYFR